MATLGPLQDLLVDSYTPRTILPRVLGANSSGKTSWRLREDSPVRYGADITFRLFADQVDALLGYLESVRDGEILFLGEGVRAFGEETGDGALKARLEALGGVRRLGYGDFTLDASFVLAELPAFATPDARALEGVPWDWVSALDEELDHHFARGLFGGVSATWNGNAPRRATLQADLTLEELLAVRLFAFHGDGRGAFPLTMAAPIFGEGTGTDHQAVLVNFQERRGPGPLLRSVSITLEKVD